MENSREREDRIMALFPYLQKLHLSPMRIELIDKVKNISNERDFIIGMAVLCKHDDDAKYMLEYIERGEEVTYSQLMAQALYLRQVRKGER